MFSLISSQCLLDYLAVPKLVFVDVGGRSYGMGDRPLLPASEKLHQRVDVVFQNSMRMFFLTIES